MKNKLAIVVGIVAVVVIGVFVFMGGSGVGPTIGSKEPAPFIAKEINLSAEIQELLKNKNLYEKFEAVRKYTQSHPEDAVAWLYFGDLAKEMSQYENAYGVRHTAMTSYYEAVKYGEGETKEEAFKRILWMISPASLETEGTISEYDIDGIFMSGAAHPIYRYEVDKLAKMYRDPSLDTPDGEIKITQAEELLRMLGIIYDPASQGKGMFYDILMDGTPTDKDYLMAAYVTIFADYISADSKDYSVLKRIHYDPTIFSLDDPKVAKIIDDEIKKGSAVGNTIKVMLEKPQDRYLTSLEFTINLASKKATDGSALDGNNKKILENEVKPWIQGAPERVKLLESVYDQLDSIGKFVLAVEYINCNVDKNYKITGQYSQKAIDCLKDSMEDPYAINEVAIDFLMQYIPMPDTEMNKIVNVISKAGHDNQYQNPDKSWGTVISKMENIQWKDITGEVNRNRSPMWKRPYPYITSNAPFWTRTILCSGTYNGDKISIIFPVIYDTTWDEWMVYEESNWNKVLVNKDMDEKLAVMYGYIRDFPIDVYFNGLDWQAELRPAPQPSREVPAWMSEILD